MPIFASSWMDNDLLSFFFFFFPLNQNFFKLIRLVLFVSCLVVFPPILKRVGVATCTRLWSLKPNHRLQVLSYDLTTSASAQKFRSS